MSGSSLVPFSTYFFSKGFRCVAPYYYWFNTFAKERWFGKRLLDVFSSEFSFLPFQYLERQLSRGCILINGSPTHVNKVFEPNDLLSHYYHVHEPPVTSEMITFVECTSDLLVVNKPSTIPVHACGQYKYNSLLYILCEENGLKPLYPIHRLDRLTSGIVLLPRNVETAKELSRQFREGRIHKEYVARVSGEFPKEEIDLQKPISILRLPYQLHSTEISVVDTVPEISNKNNDVLLSSKSLNSNPKFSRTVFKRLYYHRQSNTSIVKCIPFTGRTHQIRVHLKYLGFPVANDRIYSEKYHIQSNAHALNLEDNGNDPIHISNQNVNKRRMFLLFSLNNFLCIPSIVYWIAIVQNV